MVDYFFTIPNGLRSSYWEPSATGGILGITRGTKKGHIARAALEAIALRSHELVNAMQKDANTNFSVLKVDGGASQNNLLLQIQANVLNTKVVRPEITETTALGAAFFAGLAVGFGKAKRKFKLYGRKMPNSIQIQIKTIQIK